MSKISYGARVWLVPDGYIPESSIGSLDGHEAICVLNCSDDDASLSISFYFEDRAPVKDVRVTVPAERTRHIRTDLPDQLAGVELPKGVPYAIHVVSDVPVAVQHSRLDTSQQALALMTTLGFPVQET